jgi:hypothetical protein
MATKKLYHFLIQDLPDLIKNKWEKKFKKAINTARSKNVPLLESVTNIDQYLAWMNETYGIGLPRRISAEKILYNQIFSSYTFTS